MARYLNIVIPPVPQTLTYEVAENLDPRPEPGFRVEVPLGKRFSTGFVVGELSEEERASLKFQIKKIEKMRSAYPFFSSEQIKFFQWVADYYGTTLSTVVDVAVPPWVPQKFSKKVTFVKHPEEPPRGRLERAIIEWLSGSEDPVERSLILRRHKGASPVLKKLLEKGCIRIEEEELVNHHKTGEEAPAWAKSAVTLNSAQENATKKIISQIDKREFKTFLLYGVTGSGKTEVYIEAVRHALSKGLGALIVVPEIALTPQLIDRFKARLGDDIAVLHSGLQQRARWDGWRALLDRRCTVAIGARSAIFAPLHSPGIIIVDEEHDGSYKQAEGLRYNARDLAVARAHLEGCPVILGSATPSLETFNNALQKKYDFLVLPTRPQSVTPPEIKITDLNVTKPWEMPSKSVSPQLYDAIRDALNNREQVFVLYNRRGFASYLQCEKCNAVMKCKNCSVPLTFHRFNNSLLCHYCSLSTLPPEFCPECPEKMKNEQPAGESGSCGKLTLRGAGTEKVFEELKALFPTARIDRLDRDSASDMDAFRRILDRVRNGDTDILVGTQMIAKGHDLPGVTLVGVVDCDVGLNLPDFRAGERIFQLLTQASGRAGRGQKQGHVILQTRVPRHPALVYTVARDYRNFAVGELNVRREMNYPPFTNILRIICSAEDKYLPAVVLEDCRNFIDQYAANNKLSVQVLGPGAAPLEKLKASWRAHLLIKSKSKKALNSIVRVLENERSKSTKYRLVFDIDPQDMM